MEIPRFSEMNLWFRDTIGVIGSAAKIPLRNPSFITFVLVTSFPLFCTTLVPRLPSSQPSLIMEKAAIQLRVLTHHPKGHMIQLLRPLLSSSCSNRLLQAVNMVVPVVAFDKWVEYGAWWNLSVVVSILEKDNRGFEAFSDAAELSEGNTRRGFVLMLLYSVWSFRFPTLIAKCTFPSVMAYDVLDTSFLCLGKVMNWVVLTVYYYDCKDRHKGLP
ncbi:hypothetical protein D8674_016355 [Pyrus ussuriensis x Pyrus communis]|uniref:Uncharacterized protein n=1 Tax=Pyrus ussuriensis x Pyrus communis TaxID=2448454 RepID=A0A5N5H9U7_9ROSA|nr:hypothetical protein D8674_016355 [Pyrus ussuriensis x Pyrus communis]